MNSYLFEKHINSSLPWPGVFLVLTIDGLDGIAVLLAGCHQVDVPGVHKEPLLSSGAKSTEQPRSCVAVLSDFPVLRRLTALSP